MTASIRRYRSRVPFRHAGVCNSTSVSTSWRRYRTHDPAAQSLPSRKPAVQGTWRPAYPGGRAGARLLPRLVSGGSQPKQAPRPAHLQRRHRAQALPLRRLPFSEDLDFTLARRVEFAAIRAGLEEVYVLVAQASGIRFSFEAEDRQTHINSYTFISGIKGPCRRRTRSRWTSRFRRFCFFR
jgi:hypothetical protein